MPMKTRVNRSLMSASATFFDVLYHSLVREIRGKSGGATLGLFMTIMQTMVLLGILYVVFTVIGLMRTVAIRGDFVIFLLTGIFLFLTHIRAVMLGKGAVSPIGGLSQHAPMNPIISLLSTMLAGLYMQMLAITIILLAVHVLRGGLEFYNPAGLFFPFFMAWASGVAVGMLFAVASPFAPRFIGVTSMIYRRSQMVTSGKMMPANYMGASAVQWFDWNPLFHCIDQARGAAFVNYTPRYTNMEYPVYFTITAIVISMMVLAWLRKNMSQSWGARSVL